MRTEKHKKSGKYHIIAPSKNSFVIQATKPIPFSLFKWIKDHAQLIYNDLLKMWEESFPDTEAPPGPLILYWPEDPFYTIKIVEKRLEREPENLVFNGSSPKTDLN